MFLNESCLFCDCQTASVTGSVAPFSWWGHSCATHDTGSLCTAAGNMLHLALWLWRWQWRDQQALHVDAELSRACKSTGLAKNTQETHSLSFEDQGAFIFYTCFITRLERFYWWQTRQHDQSAWATLKQRMSMCRKQPWKHQDSAKMAWAKCATFVARHKSSDYIFP